MAAARQGWATVSDDGEEYGMNAGSGAGSLASKAGLADEPGLVSEADAEAVRAYLVAVRGGAPLLSSTDARLLFNWLSSGVRLGVIARAIDLAAQKRIAKKIRAPLTLASCRAEVERLRRGGRVRAQLAALADEPSCAPSAEQTPQEAAVAQLYRSAIARVEALDPTDAWSRCEAAVELGRTFYEAAWSTLDTAPVLAEAAASLEADGMATTDANWSEACEGIARDRLRRRYPRLTATAIWTEFGLGLA